MGVRLYPMFKEDGDYHVLMAKFLGYRPIDGILSKQFSKVLTELDHGVGQEAQERAYEFWRWFCNEFPKAAHVDSMCCDGWGKFNLDLIPSGYDYYAGHTYNGKLMKRLILGCHRVPQISFTQRAMLSGVSWG